MVEVPPIAVYPSLAFPREEDIIVANGFHGAAVVGRCLEGDAAAEEVVEVALEAVGEVGGYESACCLSQADDVGGVDVVGDGTR